jgi:hypothetical protein
MLEIECIIWGDIDYEELTEIVLYLDDEIVECGYNINDN